MLILKYPLRCVERPIVLYRPKRFGGVGGRFLLSWGQIISVRVACVAWAAHLLRLCVMHHPCPYPFDKTAGRVPLLCCGACVCAEKTFLRGVIGLLIGGAVCSPIYRA